VDALLRSSALAAWGVLRATPHDTPGYPVVTPPTMAEDAGAMARLAQRLMGASAAMRWLSSRAGHLLYIGRPLSSG
jgi:hypothetical protein